MERRKGKLTGHQVADCTVTISKIDGVESSRTITDVSPRVLMGLQIDGRGRVVNVSMEKGQKRLDFARLAQSLESFSRRSSEHSCLVKLTASHSAGPQVSAIPSTYL